MVPPRQVPAHPPPPPPICRVGTFPGRGLEHPWPLFHCVQCHKGTSACRATQTRPQTGWARWDWPVGGPDGPPSGWDSWQAAEPGWLAGWLAMMRPGIERQLVSLTKSGSRPAGAHVLLHLGLIIFILILQYLLPGIITTDVGMYLRLHSCASCRETRWGDSEKGRWREIEEPKTNNEWGHGRDCVCLCMCVCVFLFFLSLCPAALRARPGYISVVHAEPGACQGQSSAAAIPEVVRSTRRSRSGGNITDGSS